MSTAADNLLDEVMTAAEDGQPTDDRIILSIDEPSRTIKYDGDLILGVKGDKFAERVYFRCPQYVYRDENDVIDLSLPTTKIYIDYKNAYKEPYIEECSKRDIENGEYVFSWLISDLVAVKEGTVSFNICIKDESDSLLDKEGNIVIREWHTTSYTGVILPAVDVSSKTPEVITSDTVTSDNIISEYKRLTEQLSDVNDYIDETVDTSINMKLDSYVIDVIQNDNGTSYTYSSSFDFSTFDVDDSEKYTCVVDRSASGVNTDAILSTVECTVNGPITMINFSNVELSLQVQYNSDTGTTTMFEVNAIAPIAEEIYQTTAVSSEDYNSDYPLLCSDDDSPMADDNTMAMGTLRAQNITVNPVTGVITANKFIELKGSSYTPSWDDERITDVDIVDNSNFLTNEIGSNLRVYQRTSRIYAEEVVSLRKAKYITITTKTPNTIAAIERTFRLPVYAVRYTSTDVFIDAFGLLHDVWNASSDSNAVSGYEERFLVRVHAKSSTQDIMIQLIATKDGNIYYITTDNGGSWGFTDFTIEF